MEFNVKHIKALDPNKVYVVKLNYANGVLARDIHNEFNKNGMKCIVIGPDIDIISPEGLEIVQKDEKGS